MASQVIHARQGLRALGVDGREARLFIVKNTCQTFWRRWWNESLALVIHPHFLQISREFDCVRTDVCDCMWVRRACKHARACMLCGQATYINVNLVLISHMVAGYSSPLTHAHAHAHVNAHTQIYIPPSRCTGAETGLNHADTNACVSGLLSAPVRLYAFTVADQVYDHRRELHSRC